MQDKQCCGTCRFHELFDDEWCCGNEVSENYAYETEYGDYCEEYEEKEERE